MNKRDVVLSKTVLATAALALVIPLAGFSQEAVATTAMTIRPGEVRVVKFADARNGVDLFCRGDQRIKIQKLGESYVGFVTESYYSKLEPFKCAFKLGDQTLGEIAFTVEKKTYRQEKLKVAAAQVKLSDDDQKRVDTEREMMKTVYAAPLDQIQFTEPFIRPLKSRLTSMYGTARVFNGEMASQHLGWDFRAGVGARVPVANAGRVVFVGNLFRSGNLVVVDHGLGIFTTYHHLSKTLTTLGAFVKRGDVVGLAGNTGRVSGPHLHWGVNIHGDLIDGLNLISEVEKAFSKDDFKKLSATHAAQGDHS